VSPELTERVEAALLELDYRPDAVARSLRRGETLTIGLIVPNLEIPFFASVAYSIERAASNHGYSIILGNSDWEQDRESILLQNLISRQVDGLICISAGMSVAQIEPLINVGTPVVTFERKLLDSGLDAVSIDNYRGAYTATGHLLELGHRRIAVITGRALSIVSEERLEGHHDALREAGLEPNPDYVFSGDYLPEAGKLAALQILSLQKRPTAIFAFNDLMAMGALRVLGEHGLSVPDEIAVMGFDDIPICQYTNPALTTMRQPLEHMGWLAVDLLLQRIRSEDHYKARHIRLQPELIIRASTARQTLLQSDPLLKSVANA
jgi:LacI family transcriptional regulator